MHDWTDEKDPFKLFTNWYEEAKSKEINDPNAMSLATCDEQSMPNCRIVLMKDYDEKGFVFYTNTLSSKGRELENNPKAALCFHWKSVLRQIRIQGSVEWVSKEEADAYYKSRSKGSRIGAWASKQSQSLSSRLQLDRDVAYQTARWTEKEIERPPHWFGYRVVPQKIEFWHDGAFRLHDRIVFKRDNAAQIWQKERLYP